MKKIIVMAILGGVFSLLVASCGSSGGSGCDAYGYNEVETNQDLATK